MIWSGRRSTKGSAPWRPSFPMPGCTSAGRRSWTRTVCRSPNSSSRSPAASTAGSSGSARCKGSSASAVVRRSTYEALGTFDASLRYVIDWEMWVRIAARRRWLSARGARGLSHPRRRGDASDQVGSRVDDARLRSRAAQGPNLPGRSEAAGLRCVRRTVRRRRLDLDRPRGRAGGQLEGGSAGDRGVPARLARRDGLAALAAAAPPISCACGFAPGRPGRSDAPAAEPKDDPSFGSPAGLQRAAVPGRGDPEHPGPDGRGLRVADHRRRFDGRIAGRDLDDGEVGSRIRFWRENGASSRR